MRKQVSQGLLLVIMLLTTIVGNPIPWLDITELSVNPQWGETELMYTPPDGLNGTLIRTRNSESEILTFEPGPNICLFDSSTTSGFTHNHAGNSINYTWYCFLSPVGLGDFGGDCVTPLPGKSTIRVAGMRLFGRIKSILDIVNGNQTKNTGFFLNIILSYGYNLK